MIDRASDLKRSNGVVHFVDGYARMNCAGKKAQYIGRSVGGLAGMVCFPFSSYRTVFVLISYTETHLSTYTCKQATKKKKFPEHAHKNTYI